MDENVIQAQMQTLRAAMESVNSSIMAIKQGGLQPMDICARPLGWMQGGGALDVKGTEALYKPPILREYDENGDIVAVGSETTPLPEGHTLQATWDWVRMGGEE